MRHWSVILTIFILGSAFGQPVRIPVFEEPLRSEREIFQITSGTDLIVLHRTFYNQDGLIVDYVPIRISPQSDSLREFHGMIRAGEHLTMLNTSVQREAFHFLTRHEKTNELSLFTVLTDSSAYRVRTFRSALKISSIFFGVSENYAISAGYLNSRPAALFCNFKEGTARVLPGFFNRNGEINDLQIHPDGTFDILLALQFPGGKSMVIQRYSAIGDIIRTTVIRSDGNRNLMFGKMQRLSSDSLMVAGCYGRGQENSRGVFTALVTAQSDYTLRFYNYAELRNYFRFLPDRRENRVRERIVRRRTKGKPLRFPARMLVHELKSNGDGLHLLAESIQPVYRSGSPVFFRPVNTGQFAFIKPYYAQQRDMVFDGFRYTHAILLCLNRNGTLRWDNSIELKNIRTFSLRQYTVMQTEINSDSARLVYATPDALIGRSFRQGDQVPREQLLHGNKDSEQITHLLSGPGNRLFVAGIRENKVPEKPDGVYRRWFFLDQINP